MDVIRPSEPVPALQSPAEADALDERRGHGEPEKREPEDCGQEEQAVEKQGRDEDEVPHRGADEEGAPGRRLGREDDAAKVRPRHQQRECGQPEEELPVARDQRQPHCAGGRPEPECERRPEAPPVEVDRLGDQLPDRARRRRQRRRQRLARFARPLPRHANSIAAVPSQALLLIADIGGYTQFMRLHRLSLAHSEEITSRLLEAAIEAAPELELVEIEGDGAFLCAFEGSDASVADVSLAMHRAFHEKQQEIAANTLCPCEACAQVGSLRLKFVAHAGEVAEQKVRNRTSLIGLDVITVHRMLKNSVPVPEYLLVSDAVYERLDPELQERATSLVEELEGIGETSLHFVDLGAIAGLPARPEPSVTGRVRETATVLGRGMPYLLGLKSRT